MLYLWAAVALPDFPGSRGESSADAWLSEEVHGRRVQKAPCN